MWTTSLGLLLGAISLLSIANAFPHELVGRQEQCAAGTAFYVCNINNFRGCCTIDPCAIKAGCPDTAPPPSPPPSPPVSSAPPTTSPPSTPAPLPPAPATCQPGTKGFKQFNPTLRTIDAATTDPSLFHIANITSSNTLISQVFSFGNIPASARNIGLKWFISATVPEFSTKNSATGAVTLLDGTKLPARGARWTADAVTAAIDRSELNFPNGAVGGAGFGFWDGPDFPKPHDHQISSNGNLPVRSELSFSIAIKDQGEVIIRQTEQDGLYLVYDC